MDRTVVITAPTLAEAGLELLRTAGVRALFIDTGAGPAEIERVLAAEPVDAVVSRTMKLTAKAIGSCPTLRVISKHGVGVDNIDIDAATLRGIPVLITPAANSQAVAELTIALMLAVARNLTTHTASMRAGLWSRSLIGLQLHGRTLGLVGLGDIGLRVARVAAALGMRVAAYDPALVGRTTDAPVALVDDLPALLRQSNVLSVHCPLNARTKGLIGSEQLALLPSQAIVLNTARGGIVDEAALDQALAGKHLFGAGLDSFAAEPAGADLPLLRHPNVIVTPHVGGSTREALGDVARTAVQQALDVLDGKPVNPATCVNKDVLAGQRFP